MTNLSASFEKLRAQHLVPLASRLEAHLEEVFKNVPRIDRISCRAKSVKSFVKKASKINSDGSQKYPDPLEQIQDVIGARIITFYKPDVLNASQMIEDHFQRIEEKELAPSSEYEFGYFGRHYVLILPSDVLSEELSESPPQIFELQVKTLFQHAWSEASHDLDYKEENEPLTIDDRRRIAFASAQSWGADMAFEEVATNRITDFKQA